MNQITFSLDTREFDKAMNELIVTGTKTPAEETNQRAMNVAVRAFNTIPPHDVAAKRAEVKAYMDRQISQKIKQNISGKNKGKFRKGRKKERSVAPAPSNRSGAADKVGSEGSLWNPDAKGGGGVLANGPSVSRIPQERVHSNHLRALSVREIPTQSGIHNRKQNESLIFGCKVAGVGRKRKGNTRKGRFC
jgi:hypothetical protein